MKTERAQDSGLGWETARAEVVEGRIWYRPRPHRPSTTAAGEDSKRKRLTVLNSSAARAEQA